MTDEVKLRALIGEGIKSHEERKEAWILAGKPGERPTIMDSIADHLIANGVVVREKGEWEGTNCSRCGGSYMDYADADSYPAIGEPKPDFCPNCGADMRKGENG